MIGPEWPMAAICITCPAIWAYLKFYYHRRK
jgi:hypothetical protein